MSNHEHSLGQTPYNFELKIAKSVSSGLDLRTLAVRRPARSRRIGHRSPSRTNSATGQRGDARLVCLVHEPDALSNRARVMTLI